MEPREFMTRARAVIDAVWGEHHVFGMWKVRNDQGVVPHLCEFQQNGDFATFDYSDMTRFVVACHDQGLRGSVSCGLHRQLLFRLSARERTSAEHQLVLTHPTLEDHVKYIRKEISGEQFNRLLTVEP